MRHLLKTVQPYFDDVLSGVKTFEIRINDRKFSVGDTLVLCEYDVINDFYSKREILVSVIYVLLDYPALLPGYCILGFEKK